MEHRIFFLIQKSNEIITTSNMFINKSMDYFLYTFITVIMRDEKRSLYQLLFKFDRSAKMSILKHYWSSINNQEHSDFILSFEVK